MAVGVVLLLGYLAAAGPFAFSLSRSGIRARVLPWMALGAYSIASGCLAALGRIEWGVAQALESRYVPFSLHLTVAVIALAAIFFRELSERTSVLARPRWPSLRSDGLPGCAAYLTLELLCAALLFPVFGCAPPRRVLGRALSCSARSSTPLTPSESEFSAAGVCPPKRGALDRCICFGRRWCEARRSASLRHADADDAVASGWFDVLASRTGRSQASGWAALPGEGRPADCVVLAYADERGDGLFLPCRTPSSAARMWSRPCGAGNSSGADGMPVFSRDAVPPGAKISAWAVDAKGAKLYRLKETGSSRVFIDRVALRLTRLTVRWHHLQRATFRKGKAA